MTLLEIVTSPEDAIRHSSLEEACESLSTHDLVAECARLDEFWRTAPNLYHRVRALLFLAAIYRQHLPPRLPPANAGLIPWKASEAHLARRFREAIDQALAAQRDAGASESLASLLAASYRDLAFQTLADQVRRSVRTLPGNQWMFRLGHPADHPLRLRSELLQRQPRGMYPILRETTAVRMDFSHSAWSDIFFLGMDYPEGAQVLNASVNLGVHGRDDTPRPPIETYLRVIDEPVLRLVSVDLNAHADLERLPEVFDFARDYLGLVKAAVVAAGLVPPGLEGCEHPLPVLLERILGPGLGLEIVSKVNNIPKGSRLAVSTNLLGSLIALCMRATGQVASLTGPLAESERRIVAARAILGEWLGGSGGGWQDSGGLWPGIKLICGEAAAAGDTEFGVSRGRLLPRHRVFSNQEITPATLQALQDSLVLVHGGMAQNVGPLLEMVTERYLLRSGPEWRARQQAQQLLHQMTAALQAGDIRALGAATTESFEGVLQEIIPWCSNLYTTELIAAARGAFGADFWGFWMLGGMAGGGMGFLFAPQVQRAAKRWMQATLVATKRRLESSVPFAMEPVVYDFQINDQGTCSGFLPDADARMPDEYYALMLPGWLRRDSRQLAPGIRRELELVSRACLAEDPTGRADAGRRALLTRLLPQPSGEQAAAETLEELLHRQGFDREQHETVRTELQAGRIGLAQNRLPPNVSLEDVRDEDVRETRGGVDEQLVRLGRAALARGAVAVVTLAAGIGSRWTEGAGVVKALNPFCRMAGRHRRFLDVHLAKTRRSNRLSGCPATHVFTTGYLTDAPIRAALEHEAGFSSPVLVSPGRSVGLRTVPMVRDLQFLWEETAQQVLDLQQQKVRSSVRAALVNWARQCGEGADYTDNVPAQCLHPVGHWYEVPNLLRNGTLQKLLALQPHLEHLLLHNIDTLGANLDPGLLGQHMAAECGVTIEVTSRRLDDRGGGLARVDGRLRLVEGLAMPREADECRLRYYNSMTSWISVQKLLDLFGLDRAALDDAAAVEAAVRRVSQRLPTYITLKNVKKRWGLGQEDVYPVAQFEKLWGDVTALPDVSCQFVVVSSPRGQQLKHPAQLDGWLRDGSAQHVADLCDW